MTRAAAIVPFLRDGVFEPDDIDAMSMALDDVRKTLNLSDNAKAEHEAIAGRIIELARQGERSPKLLRDRILQEYGFIGRNGWCWTAVRRSDLPAAFKPSCFLPPSWHVPILGVEIRQGFSLLIAVTRTSDV